MEIKRVGSQPSAKGPSDWFTGAVRIDSLFQAPDPALVQGASVTFEPGARTDGTLIPSARRSSSRLDSAGLSAGAGRSRRSVRVTWSGFSLAKNTGTAPRRASA